MQTSGSPTAVIYTIGADEQYMEKLQAEDALIER